MATIRPRAAGPSDPLDHEIARLRELVTTIGGQAPEPCPGTLDYAVIDRAVIAHYRARQAHETQRPQVRHGLARSVLVPWRALATGFAVVLVLLLAVAGSGLTRSLIQPDSAAASDVSPLPYLADLGALDADRSAPAAAEALTEMAARARASSPDPRNGPIQHVTTATWSLENEVGSAATPEARIVPIIRYSSLYPDGRLVTEQVRGEPLDDDGHIQLRSMPDEHLGAGVAQDFLAPGSLEPDLAESLPSDPEALLGHLRTGHPGIGEGNAGFLAHYIKNLHDHFVVPGEVQSALLQSLAGMSGLHDGGPVTERLGRTAHAILVETDDRSVTALLISPTTGKLLGHETMQPATSTSHEAQPPPYEVVQLVTYVDSTRM